MGAWGTAIFSDDTAADVRDDYRDLLGDGLEPAAATDALLERMKETVADSDEGPVFWLALALTQHKLGRLEERVQREALRVIDDGLGLDRWREAGPAELRRRQAALAKTRQILASPQPPPKKVRPRFRDRCEWTGGEFVGYQLTSGGWIVLHVVGTFTHQNGEGVVCQILDWRGDALPAPEDVVACGIRGFELSAARWVERIGDSYPELANSPLHARIRVMLESGLMPAEICTDIHKKSLQYLTDAAKLIARDGPATRARLAQFAGARGVSTEPISRFGLWRAVAAGELPKKRVQRLGATRPLPASTGRQVELGWFEWDTRLATEFGVQ